MPDNSMPFNNTLSNTLYDQVSARLTSQGLASLIPTVVGLITKYGNGMPETINAELAQTEAYKKRFAGNEARKAANLPVLSESEYLYNELQYHQTLTAYGAGDLATADNFSKFIGGDVSPTELNNRFQTAVTKVNNAVASNDTALLDQLKQMYPTVQPNHLATAILMGNEGSEYLKNKFGVAEIKAAETETGVKSQLGAEFLQSQGLDRNQARQGLSAVNTQLAGSVANASIFGDSRNAQDIQTDLEKENLLGQQSKANKELASRARANFAGAAGATAQGLQRKDVGAI
jgi:hypothetical protein